MPDSIRTDSSNANEAKAECCKKADSSFHWCHTFVWVYEGKLMFHGCRHPSMFTCLLRVLSRQRRRRYRIRIQHVLASVATLW